MSIPSPNALPPVLGEGREYALRDILGAAWRHFRRNALLLTGLAAVLSLGVAVAVAVYLMCVQSPLAQWIVRWLFERGTPHRAVLAVLFGLLRVPVSLVRLVVLAAAMATINGCYDGRGPVRSLTGGLSPGRVVRLLVVTLPVALVTIAMHAAINYLLVTYGLTSSTGLLGRVAHRASGTTVSFVIMVLFGVFAMPALACDPRPRLRSAFGGALRVLWYQPGKVLALAGLWAIGWTVATAPGEVLFWLRMHGTGVFEVAAVRWFVDVLRIVAPESGAVLVSMVMAHPVVAFYRSVRGLPLQVAQVGEYAPGA